MISVYRYFINQEGHVPNFETFLVKIVMAKINKTRQK